MNGRHECKYAISEADYLLLQSRLRQTLSTDSHANQTGEYLVRSLYFDTPNDKALREKTAGVNHREKFRIRLYDHNPNFIRLEKKSKHNGICYKTSCTITKEETQAICGGNYQWMLTKAHPLLREFHSKLINQRLLPKVIVDYRRMPFVYPAGDVRITLDRQIRTAMQKTDIFEPALPCVPTSENVVLLEVKYTGFLPEFIQRLVALDSRRIGAFSKYAACRVYG